MRCDVVRIETDAHDSIHPYFGNQESIASAWADMGHISVAKLGCKASVELLSFNNNITLTMNLTGIKGLGATRQKTDDADPDPAAAAMAGHVDAGPSSAAASSSRPAVPAGPVVPEDESLIDKIMAAK